MNFVFDFGNVLVRWEPKAVFLPHFGYDEDRFDFFWEHICGMDFRNRIDAGERQSDVILEYQKRFPEYADHIAMYQTHWEEALPGEIPGMYDLVKQLKTDPKNHIYGITNWSMETFPGARRRFDVLQLIDDYVVSGAENVVKPNPEIFQIFLDRYRLEAAECVFIDDNDANVASARAIGFNGIVFHGVDDLRKELNRLTM